MLLLIVIILLSVLVLGVFWRRRRERKQKQQRIEQLRTWAAQHQALDPVVQAWIQSLTASEAEVLVELLNGYCTSLNWELGWLFAPQIKKAPVLHDALEESVSAYAHAILRSLQLEADVRAYQAYLAFDKKPDARKQRALVQQLHAKVDDHGLAPSPGGFLRRFRRKEVTRQEQIAAIRHAFERDPAQTMALLKETLVDEADAVVRRLHADPAASAPSVSAAAPA
jgi:hypothetical protein